MVRDADEGRNRATYLLDGRRVMVRDLLERGLLTAGDRLTFSRPLLGELHRATVTADGRVQLDDGQAFATPSKAAAAAADVRAMDGWRVWTVDGSGCSLDALRRQLLDGVAVGSTRTDDEVDDPAARYEFLRGARSRADAGEPDTMTVRELLSRWAARMRGYEVDERIVADLENNGLVTSPDFRRVTLDSRVVLRPVSTPVDESEPSTIVPSVLTTPADAVDEVDVGLTLGNLPSAMGGLVAVTPQATFEEAITEMALNDFSQLPVMTKGRNLRGAVTWQSIAQTRLARPDASLQLAIVPSPPEPYDRPLVDVLSRLVDEGFVLSRTTRMSSRASSQLPTSSSCTAKLRCRSS